jgi:hypothetical protein
MLDLDVIERMAARAELAILAGMSDELRQLIADAGGLQSIADLAKRWDVSRQRVKELTEYPTFPKPVLTVGRSALYAGRECDAWRKLERPTGRPRKE